jgi:hypothetical protein
MEIFEYYYKTDTFENVALSQDEIEAREIKYANWLATKETKKIEMANAKSALFERLGITEDEAKLLLS